MFLRTFSCAVYGGCYLIDACALTAYDDSVVTMSEDTADDGCDGIFHCDLVFGPDEEYF